MAEDFPLIENTIHGWIAGYYCDCILQEWSHSFEPWSTNHIKLGTFLDSLSDVSFFSKEQQYKLELICWLPKLYRLDKQKNEESFLEIIQNMDAIKNIYPESLMEETTEFFTQLKKQCILLCSQEIGFIAAKNLYKKLASENQLDKISYTSILEVLETTNANQEKLHNNINGHISSLISTYLKKYLSAVSSSFLIKAASRAVESNKKYTQDIFENKKEIRLPPELLSTVASKLLSKDTLSPALYLKDEEEKHYKEKLENIWKKSRAEYFTKVQHFEENMFTRPDSVVPSKQHTTTPVIPNSKTKNIKKTLEDLVSPVNDRYPQLKSFRKRESLKYNPPPKRKSISSYRKPWTEEQEEEFYLAVKRIGVGKWANIRDFLDTDRSNVKLKDKWRSFIQTGRIKALNAKFGVVSS